MISPATLPADVSAGITVALVALPLNLALAIACGVPAAVGVVTAVVAGVVAALTGGSHLAVTGPAAAMVPLCYEIVQRHGARGLVVAAFLAGAMQVALGLARIGRLVQSIPVSVVAGFMSGIGLLILGGQLPRMLGLPTEIKTLAAVAKDPALLGAARPAAILVGAAVLAGMLLLPRISKKLPAALLALAGATVAVVAFGVAMPSVGAIPRGIPAPQLPPVFSVDLVAILPEAFALTALASIESLLSAVAVDAMAKTPRHNSDQELVGQGLANMVSALFGGLPVTGVIVRSSVAVQSGGKTRMTPIVHAVALLGIMLVAAPVVARVPIAALAGLLVFIGLRLLEWRELRKMWSISRFEAFVFLATMAGIVLFDFIDGVMIGVVLALVHFAHTQRQLGVQTVSADEPGEVARLLDSSDGEPTHVSVVRIEGPIFFVSHTGLEELATRDDLPQHLVFDLAGVPLIDVTGLETLRAQIDRLADRGTRVLIARASEPVLQRLERAGVPNMLFGERTYPSVTEALAAIGPIPQRPPRPSPPLRTTRPSIATA
ncbi:MAG: SulP family inorganic anion transporter [Deltaproteobacteria bacterium]|nr:SulP family inorganic anion transporter [Deltaproteobacteria bacterium]